MNPTTKRLQSRITQGMFQIESMQVSKQVVFLSESFFFDYYTANTWKEL